MKSNMQEHKNSSIIKAGKSKLFFIVAFLATVFSQQTFAQAVKPSVPPELLISYYGIKDALVTGKADDAAMHAQHFLKIANGIDFKVISEGNINALLKDASAISESKDIKMQREHFANLSNNMSALAKAVKLSDQPVYQVYCPMKKASWLSSEKEIKNPYYGSAMLTCGTVKETIN